MRNKSHLLKAIFALFVVLNLTLIAGGFYVLSWFKPVDQTNKNNQQFVIPKGQSIAKIGERLEESGLIKNALAFRLIIKKDQLSEKIQAGSFKISPSMSAKEIAHALTTGTQDSWVTLQEGWRKEEIAESMTRQGFSEFDGEEFLELTMKSEGKLFPDTYLVPLEITAQQFFSLLTNTYERKVGPLNLSKNQHGLTENEVLTLASLVEREGRGITDMKNVAGILLNRLEIEMALQVDATLQYANGYDQIQKTWWKEPLAKDKEIDSPYNTYLNPGLPPTPISNPGLEAIQAVLNPIESDNLYYLHDMSGVGRYAKTYEEHLANINKYLR